MIDENRYRRSPPPVPRRKWGPFSMKVRQLFRGECLDTPWPDPRLTRLIAGPQTDQARRAGSMDGTPYVCMYASKGRGTGIMRMRSAVIHMIHNGSVGAGEVALRFRKSGRPADPLLLRLVAQWVARAPARCDQDYFGN